MDSALENVSTSGASERVGGREVDAAKIVGDFSHHSLLLGPRLSGRILDLERCLGLGPDLALLLGEVLVEAGSSLKVKGPATVVIGRVSVGLSTAVPPLLGRLVEVVVTLLLSARPVLSVGVAAVPVTLTTRARMACFAHAKGIEH